MKATGEVMSIGRTFEESLLKAIRSLEIGVCHIQMDKFNNYKTEELMDYIKDGRDDRIYAISELMRRNVDIGLINNITKIDMFFLEKIRNIVKKEKNLAEKITYGSKVSCFWQKPSNFVKKLDFIWSVWKIIMK